MIVYRLTDKAFKSDLSGLGAEKYGGRWNNAGVPMLYTCEHQSLCVLERAVHMQLSLMSRMELVMISIEIPDAAKNVAQVKGLPYRWREIPFNNQTQDLGDEFIFSQKHLAMKVPSVIVPQEYNVLINPRHRLADKVRIIDERPFVLDKRLFD